MSRKIKAIHPLDNIKKAIKKLIEFNIKKLPVVQEDEIVRIIRVTDIARFRLGLIKKLLILFI